MNVAAGGRIVARRLRQQRVNVRACTANELGWRYQSIRVTDRQANTVSPM